MHLSAHYCAHRPGGEDLEASRRQADAARATRRVRAARSGRIGRPAVDCRGRCGGPERLQSVYVLYPLPLFPANPTERLRDTKDRGASIRFRDRAARR
ncbi:MAG: hypothetical protein HYT86_04430 [candidate division NC10 bacterium]|nr:hypothetical protein [candidate division NC10 bacterium]